MIKHTLGPWEAMNAHITKVDPGAAQVIFANDLKKIIAFVGTEGDEEAMGNTFLITSAPYMENALEQIAGSPHGAHCPGFGARKRIFKCTCHVSIAKDALSQAKGN